MVSEEMINKVEMYAWTIYENEEEYIRVLDVIENGLGDFDVKIETCRKDFCVLVNEKLPVILIPFELYLEKIKDYEKVEPFTYFKLMEKNTTRLSV